MMRTVMRGRTIDTIDCFTSSSALTIYLSQNTFYFTFIYFIFSKGPPIPKGWNLALKSPAYPIEPNHAPNS